MTDSRYSQAVYELSKFAADVAKGAIEEYAHAKKHDLNLVAPHWRRYVADAIDAYRVAIEADAEWSAFAEAVDVATSARQWPSKAVDVEAGAIRPL